MTDTILERLRALAAECEASQKMLAELDARRASVTQMMLRVAGATPVLKELLQQGAGASGSPPAPVHRPQLAR